MKKILVLLLALSACSPAGQEAKDAAGSKMASSTSTAGGSAESLTGLYEGGQAGQPNQLCMVGEGQGSARFGLVVWGANLHSCSGTGTATRSSTGIRLAMAGDSECVIAASESNGTITLPKAVPAGCAYYCGARARLDGVTFARKGTSRADALKARDLVGESLCAR